MKVQTKCTNCFCLRFSKRKIDLPQGRVVQGVFTKDFRKDTLKCQILVTVPECLEILLLSPSRREWSRRIRYVIFDEVSFFYHEASAVTYLRCITLGVSLAERCGSTSSPSSAAHSSLCLPQSRTLTLYTAGFRSILHLKFNFKRRNISQRAEQFKMERDVLDGIKEERSYKVQLVPSQGKIERHADLKKFVFR